MHLILAILQCIILLVIVYQDFRFRALSVFLLAFAFAVFSIRSLMINGWKSALLYSGINLLVIVLQMAGVFGYFSLKRGKVTNIIDCYIGRGDLLFFLILIFGFSPFNFVFFNLLGYLIILIVFALVQLISKKNGTIPLAGCLALAMCMIIIFNQITCRFNTYNDNILLDFLERF